MSNERLGFSPAVSSHLSLVWPYVVSWITTRKDHTMAENKVQEAALNLTQALSETGQAIANSAVAAQQRNMKYIQSTFEEGIEVLKGNVEGTRSLMGNLEEQPQKLQGALQAITESAVAAQERNTKFVQNAFENGFDVFKNHVESTRALTRELMNQSQKQLAAFQTLAHESVDAYIEFFNAPLSYYDQTTESLASWGLKTTQHVTK